MFLSIYFAVCSFPQDMCDILLLDDQSHQYQILPPLIAQSHFLTQIHPFYLPNHQEIPPDQAEIIPAGHNFLDPLHRDPAPAPAVPQQLLSQPCCHSECLYEIDVLNKLSVYLSVSQSIIKVPVLLPEDKLSS